MRTYLVVIDDTPEASVALRFAAHRAVKTGGGAEIVALLPAADLMPWGGVQATIEEEARVHAEGLVQAAAGTLIAESGLKPHIAVARGDARKVIRDQVAANPNIAALVLAAAASGTPGPLIAYFAGSEAGTLSVPIMIVPGGLTPEEIDRLS
ncbi:MAG: universal stress protein [Sphingomonas sp.]|uniref:universal stress protein n=1 Tax=Sphingomonas sp. TaxID=28214 RepID=UPI0025DA8515|nr:universal stress protein [Sphingomonas sp.]MBX9881706.1 universal stress protein [Sphingomonas sp.]